MGFFFLTIACVVQKYVLLHFMDRKLTTEWDTDLQRQYCHTLQCLIMPHLNAWICRRNKHPAYSTWKQNKNRYLGTKTSYQMSEVTRTKTNRTRFSRQPEDKNSLIIHLPVHRRGLSLSTPDYSLSSSSNIMAKFKSKFKLCLAQVCNWASTGYSVGGVSPTGIVLFYTHNY